MFSNLLQGSMNPMFQPNQLQPRNPQRIREQLTSHGVHLPFEETSLSQAIAKSKREMKFLWIFLYSSAEDTLRFCQETLSSEAVQTFLTDHFIVWIAEVTDREGYPLVQSLGVSQSPAVIVLFHSSRGERVVADTLPGSLPPDLFLERMVNVLDKKGTLLDEAIETQ